MDLSEVRLFLSFDFLPISEGDANVVLPLSREPLAFSKCRTVRDLAGHEDPRYLPAPRSTAILLRVLRNELLPEFLDLQSFLFSELRPPGLQILVNFVVFGAVEVLKVNLCHAVFTRPDLDDLGAFLVVEPIDDLVPVLPRRFLELLRSIKFDFLVDATFHKNNSLSFRSASCSRKRVQETDRNLDKNFGWPCRQLVACSAIHL